MKRFPPIIIVLLALGGCRQQNAVSTDPAQNRYFSAYDSIYRQWGKVSPDTTSQQLAVYLREFPENDEAQAMAGYLKYKQGNYPKALEHWQNAISLHPEKAIYYSGKGSVFGAANQADSAEKYLLRALSLGDSSGLTLANTAMAYLKKGDKQKCQAYAVRALARDSSAVVLSELSYLFGQVQQAQNSRMLFKKASEMGLKDTSAFAKVLAGELKPEDYYRTNY